MIFMRFLFAILVVFITLTCIGQSFTSYFTGNMSNIVTNPLGGSCLMGGATEDDEAIKWFLTRANGGDVLVLRASGTDGYNDYFYSNLGVTINSVETIVFHNGAASNEAYIHDKINQAEAIWIAGGNQWNYISFWRDTPIDSLINKAIQERNVVIGGTSAGMAIQGAYYFTAENNTVTSSAALQNPYNNNVTVNGQSFLKVPFLTDVITDTHYDNPDRRGRHSVFLARILTDNGVMARGIACDEYTAVCIDELGIARVYGAYPTYDDNAYFIQVNCEINNNIPENCSSGNPLTWNQNGAALKVYAVKGTSTGANTFNLNDWKTGNGGSWQHWSVDNGVFSSVNGSPIDCGSAGMNNFKQHTLLIYPNPAENSIHFNVNTGTTSIIEIYNSNGALISSLTSTESNLLEINVSSFEPGVYFVKIENTSGTTWGKFVK
jgi:cyanophycinase-like exopeptidase